jgi:prepilin-type N-terminal cleavage/methylation domain-containing protein
MESALTTTYKTSKNGTPRADKFANGGPMRPVGRRGFTLVELMIAMVVLLIVTAGIYRVLVTNQRVFHAQTQRIDLQQNIRSAATIFSAEFHTLDASDGDILAMAADSIRIREMRVFGIICDPPVLGGVLTSRTMTVRNALTYGTRAFNPAGDSLLIYYEGDKSARSDDSWVPARLTATNALNCTGDNKPGLKLTADLGAFVSPQVNQAGKIAAGAPVWDFEDVTYKVYQEADGNWYVGLRNAGGLQPVIGPVAGAGGLTFTYYDAADVVTAVPANVAEIEIRLRERTAQPIQLPEGGQVTPVDSIVTRVALRNNRRF